MAKTELENLKDYSTSTILYSTNDKLYKTVTQGGITTLNTTICEVVGDKQKIEPILEIKKGDKENEIVITTFGYIGKFSYLGVNFNIGYRFGDVVLNRMISKVNDFEVKSLSLEADNTRKTKKVDNLVLKILYLNFIFKLEKLSVIGLPKSYLKIEHHDNKLKGQLDINRFIKKDMPFQGKTSSTFYEQHYVQDIVDVLHGALSIVETNMKGFVNNRVFQIRNLLNHHANRVFVDERTIENAIYHKSIQNSLYSDFKGILEIARYIINYNSNLAYKKDKFLNGLILDVSLLWESYLYKLLKENFEDDDWEVIHEEKLPVYDGLFYQRHMYPDIVIKNKRLKKLIVLDAKSKSMNFIEGIGNGKRGDLDRTDFFQIHTYMSYYKNHEYDVIAGGLLYPIKKEFDCRFKDPKNCKEDYKEKKAHFDNWFGDINTKFIVDGIDLSYIERNTKGVLDEREKEKIRMNNILNAENNFIDRIKQIRENTK